MHHFSRRQSVAVAVGKVIIGGGQPIVVQSMTNTDTEDAEATFQQVKALADAGSELVRITVNTKEAARQVPRIREMLDKANCDVPLIGDFHYNGHTLLTEDPECAKALAKYRINPGNVGFGDKKDKQFAMMIEAAMLYQKPVRIGVNWGSLDQALLTDMMNSNAKLAEPLSAEALLRETMVTSAIASAKAAEALGMSADKIILACKTSRVSDLITIYQMLAERCDYALHLGLTEAGMGSKGIVASSIGIGNLLYQGIGDTIRASLTPEPGGDRSREVQVCQEILQCLGMRAFQPMVSACPGCGRTSSSIYQTLAQEIQSYLREQMPIWRKNFKGIENLNVAVMGCIVNGPGESKHANIGISLPGNGETPVAPVFIDGKKAATLRGDKIAEEFKSMVINYINDNYKIRETV